MAYTRADISPDAAARAWHEFNHHHAKIVLHNKLVDRLESLRTELENAPIEKVGRLQEVVQEVRRWLGKLHEKDSPEIKEFYENTPQH